MFKLSEELRTYVDLDIVPMMVPNVLMAFNLMDEFQLPFYEDKYFNIIYDEDVQDPMNRSVIFLNTIVDDLTSIVNSHKITFNEARLPKLDELNEICSALLKLQRLEDYSFCERILSTNSSAKNKLIELLLKYSSIDFIVALDTIEEVSEEFLEMLLVICKTKIQAIIEEERNVEDDNQLGSDFILYCGEVETLGKKLHDMGYTRALPFDELFNLLPFSVNDHLKNRLKDGTTYATLDLLSLFLMCTDTRDNPIQALKERIETYFDDMNTIMIVQSTFAEMYTDFIKQYVKVVKSEDDNVQTNDK